ncbi:WD40 repeat domain-containing protein [Cryptosporangium arvum]|uniref:WD40 repeat domain-containing protein n=1 Tax=Cryptosporangium arvum TaxID=80871 RepID=UPI0012ED76FD|nr:hypothetical protein [Cryptosporangium arvum]
MAGRVSRPDSADTQRPDDPAPRKPRGRHPWRWVVAGIAIVVLVLAVVWRWPEHEKPGIPTLAGEPGSVTTVSFARLVPDMLLAAGPHTVRIWDTTARRVLRAFPFDHTTVTAAALDPLNRNVVAVGQSDGRVSIRDVETGRSTMNVGDPSHGRVTALAFDPHTRYLLAVADSTGGVTLWNTGTGARVRSIAPRPASTTAVAFDGSTRNTLATSSGTGQVTLWDTSNGQRVRTLAGPDVRVVAFGFDPLTPKTLVTGHPGGAMRVWDSSNGTLVREFGGDSLTALAFNHLIRNSIASGDDAGDVTIRDTSTGRAVHVVAGTSPVTSLSYSLDGRVLAVASEDGNILLQPVSDWQ